MRRISAAVCVLALAGCNGDPVFPVYAPDACVREVGAAIPEDRRDNGFDFAVGMCMGVDAQMKEYLKANWSGFPADRRRDCLARMRAQDPQFVKGAANYIGLRKCIEPDAKPPA